MNLSSSIVRVAAGEHLVARHGGTVVLVCPRSPEHESFADQLLALCAASGEGGPALVRRAGALVTSNPAESVPGFGILCQTADGVVALLAGEVGLTFVGGGAVEKLDGKEASTYVERMLRGEYDELVLAVAGAPPADPRSRLGDGVVRGGGVLLLAGSTVETLVGFPPTALESGPEPEESSSFGAVEQSTTAVAPRPAVATFESISLTEETAPEEAVPLAPVPAETAPLDAQPIVDGIYCSRSHFNAPDAIFCSGCGISMVQQTHNRVPGPRPPWGCS